MLWNDIFKLGHDANWPDRNEYNAQEFTLVDQSRQYISQSLTVMLYQFLDIVKADDKFVNLSKKVLFRVIDFQITFCALLKESEKPFF